MHLIGLILLFATCYAGQIYLPPPQQSYHQPEYHVSFENGNHAGYQEIGSQHQSAQGVDKHARILSYQSDSNDHGYQYGYETENGIKVQETGVKQGKSIQTQGAYSYTGDDGQVYTVTYTADESGFHAQGAHLPTPPPTPEAILKALEQNAHEEANGIFDDGGYKEQSQGQEEFSHPVPNPVYESNYSEGDSSSGYHYNK